MRPHFNQFLLLLALLATGGPSLAADDEAQRFLSLQQAREYMVTLINRDRQAHGLSPVILDPVASQAGQIHTDDMVLNNHGGHYDTDGKKPWQRYTQCGGTGYVSENAFWWPARSYEGDTEFVADKAQELLKNENRQFALHPVQTFKKSDIEEAESAYYNEKPPNDGHRKNILDPIHNGVGIAFSLAANGTEYRFANTQEFTENYGQFDRLPADMSRPFYVGGLLAPGWKVQCVSISWEPAPQPMTPESIDKLESYKHPTKTLQNFFAVPWAKPPVETRDYNVQQQFRVVVTPEKGWKPGLYYVDVRAEFRGGKAEIVSRRTLSCY